MEPIRSFAGTRRQCVGKKHFKSIVEFLAWNLSIVAIQRNVATNAAASQAVLTCCSGYGV